MKIKYDKEANAAYISLVDEIKPGGVVKTYACDPVEVGGMINLDFDSSGKLLGIELIDATQYLLPEVLEKFGE